MNTRKFKRNVKDQFNNLTNTFKKKRTNVFEDHIFFGNNSKDQPAFIDHNIEESLDSIRENFELIEEKLPSFDNDEYLKNKLDEEQIVALDHLCTDDENPEDIITKQNPFLQRLGSWAVEENICHVSLGKLLKVLREEPFDQTKLPCDPRTLLKTVRSAHYRDVAPGLFYYFGIRNSIMNFFLKYGLKIDSKVVLKLAINVDGLPLSKSTGSSFWPILGTIKTIEKFEDHVLMFGLYHGNQKPLDSNEFLSDFV